MKSTIISKAPARICLFGDHQDYLHLPIIACAINRHITLTAKLNLDSRELRLNKPDINEKRNISIDEDFSKFKKGDHLMAVLKVLKKRGCIPDVGYDISLKGNIAINAGTSSSSAVVVAWIRFLLEAFGKDIEVTSQMVAEIAYLAEVEEQNSPGGCMDQYSISMGNILFLQTEPPVKYEIFKREIEGLVLGDSGIAKETIGVLGDLKTNALASIAKVAEKVPDFKLKEVTVDQIEPYTQHIPSELQIYFRAAIKNHDITRRALLEFRKETLDLPKIGQLMYEHHLILRDYLDLTIPLIDDMIDAAMNVGAYGAKIVGSGRGGSIAALAPPEKVEAVVESIKKTGPRDAYGVAVDPGAQIVN